MADIELVATCDAGYLEPLETMLLSAATAHAGSTIRLWLIHSSIVESDVVHLRTLAARIGAGLELLRVDVDSFSRARSSSRYPKEMYYRLLAPHLLPDHIERALYLDPDTLVINPVEDLFNIDLEGNAFAAASHTDLIHPATGLNHVRLGTEGAYFNTGVLLYDMASARNLIDPRVLFEEAERREGDLLFPDQDLFNIMFGSETLLLDDVIWNYDARKALDNAIRTLGRATLDWVLEHSSILHFCGRSKPWRPGYTGTFSVLYKHYRHRAHALSGRGDYSTGAC